VRRSCDALGRLLAEPVQHATDCVLNACPRCGGRLAVDPKTGMPWCDACYLDALGVRFT